MNCKSEDQVKQEVRRKTIRTREVNPGCRGNKKAGRIILPAFESVRCVSSRI